MFHSLDGVDWELLHRQKLVLLNQINDGRLKPSDQEALWGIVHLLDALQDDAITAGRWVFPDEPVMNGGA
ncbi:MAG: hypothetical protein ACE5EQ_07920 [Phycisphaerae bacterium]